MDLVRAIGEGGDCLSASDRVDLICSRKIHSDECFVVDASRTVHYRSGSGNALHAIVKRRDFVNVRTGETTTLNRTVIPLFVRWLLSERPGLKAELRRSFFDVLFTAGEVVADD